MSVHQSINKLQEMRICLDKEQQGLSEATATFRDMLVKVVSDFMDDLAKKLKGLPGVRKVSRSREASKTLRFIDIQGTDASDLDWKAIISMSLDTHKSSVGLIWQLTHPLRGENRKSQEFKFDDLTVDKAASLTKAFLPE